VEQQVVIRTAEMQRIEASRGKPMDQILRDLYVTQGMTLEAVGAELGITKGAVSRWLERFAIPTRRPGPERTEALA
jgi:transposase